MPLPSRQNVPPSGKTVYFSTLSFSFGATGTLRWASYRDKNPTCPQCKPSFEVAEWFVPHSVPVDGQKASEEDLNNHQHYYYAMSTPGPPFCSSNTRWRGDNGHIRANHTEAQPLNWQCSGGAHPQPTAETNSLFSSPPSSSTHRDKKLEKGGVVEVVLGRRANKAMKREVVDKAALFTFCFV
ncbi:unnamed protein product [Spirodela intermedia]|uniref:Uncharacterized protein n=1 Tax=Spirodela intermedia TaxID=51605 RepID=A0A811G8E7_SPIIN|nr:unnamed protein product [Spirodela intermedia]